MGIVGFAAASALGGGATGFEMLVVARALQGVFGALLAPAALPLLNTTFTDARERARAFSVYGAVAGAGGAVGLLLGGILTDALDWRWTLYVNVVIAVVAFAGGSLLLHHHRDARGAKLDVPGTLLAATGLFSVVNAMQQVGGSVGTALLNTLAASAATDYLTGRDPGSGAVRAQATIESYTTAFWWSAVFFAAGALIALVLYRRGVPRQDAGAAPVVHL